MNQESKIVQLIGGPADGESLVIPEDQYKRGVIAMHRFHFVDWQAKEDDPVPVRNIYYRQHPKHSNVWLYDDTAG